MARSAVARRVCRHRTSCWRQSERRPSGAPPTPTGRREISMQCRTHANLRTIYIYIYMTMGRRRYVDVLRISCTMYYNVYEQKVMKMNTAGTDDNREATNIFSTTTGKLIKNWQPVASQSVIVMSRQICLLLREHTTYKVVFVGYDIRMINVSQVPQLAEPSNGRVTCTRCADVFGKRTWSLILR